MNSDPNHSHQAHAHRHIGSTPPNTASAARSTRYTCPMPPEIVRDAPGSCPKCGMTLIPIREAAPRAAGLSRATMRNTARTSRSRSATARSASRSAPGYIEQVWNLEALSGIEIYGLPIEELMFGFSFGLVWTGIYEHLTWNRSVAG